MLFLCEELNLAVFLFFFQAEDGIRDLYVTGVQTCALPISAGDARHSWMICTWITERAMQKAAGKYSICHQPALASGGCSPSVTTGGIAAWRPHRVSAEDCADRDPVR